MNVGNYSVAWYAAIAVAIVGVIAGILSGVGYLGPHPSWLTPDISATAGIVSAICVGVAAFLPQIQRTPGVREESYLLAAQGKLPKDLARRYPLVIPAVPVSGDPPHSHPETVWRQPEDPPHG